MDLQLQTKLLRFLQTGQFTKVGGSVLEDVDVRIVCATNRDPVTEVQAGRFREDLFYRLHVIPIQLPPLRERGNDIIEIASYFFKRFAEQEGRNFECLSEAAQERLRQHDWPGNVRELENVVRNVIVMNDAAIIEADVLTPLTGTAERHQTLRKAPTTNPLPKTRSLDQLAERIRPSFRS